MKLKIQYFAGLRDQRGIEEESIETDAENSRELYLELKSKYDFEFDLDHFKVAINDGFADWNQPLAEGDLVTFIPPVGGG